MRTYTHWMRCGWKSVLAIGAAALFMAPLALSAGFVELQPPGADAPPAFIEDGPVTTIVIDAAGPATGGDSRPTLFVHTRNLTGEPANDRLAGMVRQELVSILMGPCHVIQPEDMMDLADSGSAAALDEQAGNELENRRTEQMASTVANLARSAGAEFGLVVELSAYTANARPVSYRSVAQNQLTIALRCTARVFDAENLGKTLLQRSFSTQKTLMRPADYEFGPADAEEVEPQLAVSAAQGVGQQFLDNLGELAAARLAHRQQGLAAAAPGAASPGLVNFFVLAEPKNAMIRIDGLTRPQHGEFLYRVSPGRHQLTVSAPNYRTVQTTVLVEDNTVLNVPLALSESGQAYAERAASLQVFKDQAEAEIHIARSMAGAVVSAVPVMATINPASLSQPGGAVDNAITQLSTPTLTAPGETATDPAAGAEEEKNAGGSGKSAMDRVLDKLLD